MSSAIKQLKQIRGNIILNLHGIFRKVFNFSSALIKIMCMYDLLNILHSVDDYNYFLYDSSFLPSSLSILFQNTPPLGLVVDYTQFLIFGLKSQ